MRREEFVGELAAGQQGGPALPALPALPAPPGPSPVPARGQAKISLPARITDLYQDYQLDSEGMVVPEISIVLSQVPSAVA